MKVAIIDPMVPLVAPNVEIPWWWTPPVLSAKEPTAFNTIPPEVVPPATVTKPTVPPLTFTPVFIPAVVPGEVIVTMPLAEPAAME